MHAALTVRMLHAEASGDARITALLVAAAVAASLLAARLSGRLNARHLATGFAALVPVMSALVAVQAIGASPLA